MSMFSKLRRRSEHPSDLDAENVLYGDVEYLNVAKAATIEPDPVLPGVYDITEADGTRKIRVDFEDGRSVTVTQQTITSGPRLPRCLRKIIDRD